MLLICEDLSYICILHGLMKAIRLISKVIS
jgi:hypothetical protein